MLSAIATSIMRGIRKINGNNYLDKQLQELRYATIFHDTVLRNGWFDIEKQSFSLGRYAVGYNYYYVAYRILNEMHPKHILEMGLGQSTKIMSLYAQNFECDHIVIEHNEEWKNFFCKSFSPRKRIL